MTTQEERMKILDMIAKGQITADQGAQLLDATEGDVVIEKDVQKTASEPVRTPAPAKMSTGNGDAKRLRVLVTSKSGSSKVNVNLPLKLMEVGLRFGGRFVDELKDIDDEMDLLMKAIREDVTGKIVEVDDEDEHVEIYIE